MKQRNSQIRILPVSRSSMNPSASQIVERDEVKSARQAKPIGVMNQTFDPAMSDYKSATNSSSLMDT